MEQAPLLFSLLFFTAFSIYLFLGIYIIHMNPRASLNQVFLAVCVSLCLWSLGFSIANAAPDLETCLLWRRVSAFGWASLYSVMLYFFILLTGEQGILKRWKLCLFVHIPAVIAIYVFSLSTEIAPIQYNLVKMDYGWLNMAVQNGWRVYFHVYYIGYVLACLGGLSGVGNANRPVIIFVSRPTSFSFRFSPLYTWEA